MRMEEINELFPPSYGGVAQISDLRLALTRLVTTNEINGIQFYEVADIAERDAIDAENADICKVHDSDGNGNPQTYIYWDDHWIVLVENTGGGGGPAPSGTQTTEKFTVSIQQEQDQKITLQHYPNQNFHIFVFLNGMYMTMGNDADYTISGQDLLFNGNILTTDDRLTVKYTY